MSSKGRIGGVKSDLIAVDDPAAAGSWKIPQHLLAQAEPTSADDRERLLNMNRSHCLMVSAEGSMHPVLLSGYLADAQVPLTFMREIAATQVAAAAREDWADADEFAASLAVYSAVPDGQQFNPFGTLLATDVGCTLEPLYGPVFFTRAPHLETGVTPKLSVQQKDALAFKLVTLQSVIEGVRPDYLAQSSYEIIWIRLKTVIDAHRLRAQP